MNLGAAILSTPPLMALGHPVPTLLPLGKGYGGVAQGHEG
jgi:hypothetical protein